MLANSGLGGSKTLLRWHFNSTAPERNETNEMHYICFIWVLGLHPLKDYSAEL